MLSLLAVIPLTLGADIAGPPSTQTDHVYNPAAARGAHLSPASARMFSKKERWLAEKERRPDVHLTAADLRKGVARSAGRRVGSSADAPALLPRPGSRIVPVTTLYNIWTREALPLLPGDDVADRFHGFLRDHYTNQATRMDTRLVQVLTSVARKFDASRIEVVSGYRSPKYNLMLRKKGRQVARTSQHVEGNAVDFRVRGVQTKTLLRYVRSLGVGGVGFYPHSQFVHADTGRVRFWTGS